MEYEESIKVLESAQKGLQGIIDKMEKQAIEREDKRCEFCARITEYEKATKLLRTAQRK